MTYAYLKKYAPSSTKSGFYIDGPSWTLQTSHSADQFFRQSNQYHDDMQLPLTVVKTMVHLGEIKTGGRTPKAEMLDWFPYLNPDYCDMRADQINELTKFVNKCVDDNQKQSNSKLMDFLRKQTPLTVTNIE